MAANAGYSATMKVAVADTGYATLGIVTSASVDIARAMLEITALGDTSPKKIAGLKTFDVSVECKKDASDTTGQGLVMTALGAGSALWVEFKPDGTNGFKCQCIVSKASIKVTPGGTADMSISLEANGAWAAV